MSIRKVMIEDGDAFMRMCTKKLLVENGFEVAEATNGIVAIWDSEPDMALTEITEPSTASQAAWREILEHEPQRQRVVKTGAMDAGTISAHDEEGITLNQS